MALEVAAWSWERDEKAGVGEGNLITPSPDVKVSLSLKELEASWLGSDFCTEVLTKLY